MASVRDATGQALGYFFRPARPVLDHQQAIARRGAAYERHADRHQSSRYG